MQKFKNSIITIFFAVAIVTTTQAQDIIVTVKAEKIEAKITEDDINEVRYKQYDYQDGPTYIIKKSEIDSIVFQNGQVTVFEKVQEGKLVTNTIDSNIMDYKAFKKLKDKQMSAFLKKNDAANYAIFSHGEKQTRIGKILFIPSIAITGVGAVTIVLGGMIIPLFLLANPFYLSWWLDDVVYTFLKVGAYIIAAAQPFWVASIVLRANGVKLKKQAKNNYIDKYLKPSTETSLNFNIYPNGFGVSLKF